MYSIEISPQKKILYKYLNDESKTENVIKQLTCFPKYDHIIIVYKVYIPKKEFFDISITKKPIYKGSIYKLNQENNEAFIYEKLFTVCYNFNIIPPGGTEKPFCNYDHTDVKEKEPSLEKDIIENIINICNTYIN